MGVLIEKFEVILLPKSVLFHDETESHLIVQPNLEVFRWRNDNLVDFAVLVIQ